MKSKQLGYDINTGEPILSYADRMVHAGNGFYVKASEITEEDKKRHYHFCGSVDGEVAFKKQGFEEH